MFSVLFEVHPKSDQWETYLGLAKMLRPELEQIEGFVENVRYRSLTREEWILSLSNWENEKALVRWRTQANHHSVQQKGRDEVLADYHLRVGQITHDTALPADCSLPEQRLDETETGEATSVTLIDAKRAPEWVKVTAPEEIAKWLGHAPGAPGLVGWDVFEAVLTPGNVILLLSWRDAEAGGSHEKMVVLPEGARLRRVRVVRDYGMFDRREAPQYYAEAGR